jgi:hypothetical protein
VTKEIEVNTADPVHWVLLVYVDLLDNLVSLVSLA